MTTCMCDPLVKRRGGEGHEREGRSHALAEEDGRERVVLADWRHVGRGLVCGVAKLIVRIIIAPLQNSIVRHLIVSPEVGGTVDGARAVRKLAVRARWRVTRVAAKITFVVVRGVRAIPLVVRRMHPPVLARAHLPVLRRVDLPTRRAAHQKVAPPATRRAWYGRARARRAGCREH